MQRRDGFRQVVEEVRNGHPDGVQIELGEVAGAQIERHQPERPQQRFTLLLAADPLVILCKIGIQNSLPPLWNKGLSMLSPGPKVEA